MFLAIEVSQSQPSFNHLPQLIDRNRRRGCESLAVSNFIQITGKREVLGAAAETLFQTVQS